MRSLIVVVYSPDHNFVSQDPGYVPNLYNAVTVKKPQPPDMPVKPLGLLVKFLQRKVRIFQIASNRQGVCASSKIDWKSVLGRRTSIHCLSEF